MSLQKGGWYRGDYSRWRSEVSVNEEGELEEINFIEILNFNDLYYKLYIDWWNDLATEVKMFDLLSGI